MVEENKPFRDVRSLTLILMIVTVAVFGYANGFRAGKNSERNITNDHFDDLIPISISISGNLDYYRTQNNSQLISPEDYFNQGLKVQFYPNGTAELYFWDPDFLITNITVYSVFIRFENRYNESIVVSLDSQYYNYELALGSFRQIADFSHYIQNVQNEVI